MGFDFGFDIGIDSVGWAVINTGKPRIEDVGVRVFDAAEIKGLKDKTIAEDRRMARGARRRNRRKKHRLQRIRNLFIKEKLLSKQDCKRFFAEEIKISHKESPWELRVRALDEKLKPSELARALYHIAKRRGFKSNRKKVAVNLNESDDKKKEAGKLKTAVSKNKSLLNSKGYRTVAEMFVKDEKFNPEDSFLKHYRNKGGEYIHTVGREELVDEVKTIIKYQKEFNFKISENPKFSMDEFQDKFLGIVTGQRDFSMGPAMKSGSPYAPKEGENLIMKMVGFCTLEDKTKERRCAKACYSFELFRALCSLNNMRLVTLGEGERSLTQEEKEILLNEAHTIKTKTKAITYKKVRKFLKLKEETSFKGLIYGEKKDPERASFIELKGYHRIKDTLGPELWAELEKREEQREILDKIGEIFTFYKTDETIKRELGKLGLAQGYVKKLETMDDFSGVGHLSLKALNNLIPFLERGMRYDEACNEAYPNNQVDSEKKRKFLRRIPDEEIVNPAVIRALTQARKVLNALIRKYGSPDKIFIELTRELKKSKRDRLEIQRRNEKRKSERDEMIKLFEDKFKRKPNRKNDDLLKYELYEQQHLTCAYSLKPINIERLFEIGYVEIDHILPHSRTLDNSQSNKVLVLTDQNRNKGNQTPYEWFGNDKDRWYKFESFVKKTNFSKLKKQKLLKKKLSRTDAVELSERSIRDTSFIARYFKNFVEKNLLFAHTDKGKRKVFTVNGAITAYLRYHWGLSRFKKRDENVLHHALDAVIVACVSEHMKQRISRYSKRKEFYNLRIDGRYIDPETGEVLKEKYRNSSDILFPMPWEKFELEVRKRIFGLNKEDNKTTWLRVNDFVKFQNYDSVFLKSIKPIFVSRMPKRKVTGRAHKDTIRSNKFPNKNNYTVSKILVHKLKKTDLMNLVCLSNNSDQLLYKELSKRFEKDGKIVGEIRKPKKDGSPGPIVRSVKVFTNIKTGIDVNKGKAENAEMVRIDVFVKTASNGKNYNYIVPVYVPDTIKKELPMEIAPSTKKNSHIDESYNFRFSLYPNDLIKVTLADGTVEMGYYSGFNINNGKIKYYEHDAPSKDPKFLKDPGSRKIKIDKYQIDVLGNFHKVGKEERQGFV